MDRRQEQIPFWCIVPCLVLACSSPQPATGDETATFTSGPTATMGGLASSTATTTGSAGGGTGTQGTTTVGRSTGAGGMQSAVSAGATSVGGAGTMGVANSSSFGGSSAGGSTSDAVGSATTGSSGDRAGAGGSGGTGGNSGCPADAMVCDDFESGGLDQWQLNEQGGTLSISSTLAAHGSASLLVDVPVGKAGGFLRLTGAPLFPLPANVLWGRAMVLFEASVPPQHTDLVRGSDAQSSVPFYNLGSQTAGWPDAPSGAPSILLNYYAGSSAVDCWGRPNPNYEVPADTWMCWEWKFDGGSNQIEFYIDGSLERLVDQTGDGCLQGNPTWDAPTFGSFEIGALVSQGGATEPQRIWIDDVAAGVDARLGCP